jgi:cell envelope opacity-associated protein A
MLVLGALVLVNLYVFVWDKKTGVRAIKQQAEAVTATPSGAPAMSIPSAPLPPARAGSAVAPAPSAVAPTTVIEGKVAKSDTLGKLLKHSGLTVAESDEIIRALSGVLDFRAIRAGQTFRIERAADGRVKRFELDLSKSHRVSAERQASGELRADAT